MRMMNGLNAEQAGGSIRVVVKAKTDPDSQLPDELRGVTVCEGRVYLKATHWTWSGCDGAKTGLSYHQEIQGPLAKAILELFQDAVRFGEHKAKTEVRATLRGLIE